MTRDEWIVTFAAELGVPALSSAEIGALLDLAAVAAHASERTAAPLSCWLAGRAIEEIERAAARVAAA
jgi:hypothetical protein